MADRQRAGGGPPQRIAVLFVIYGLDLAGPELRLLEFARRFPDWFDVHVAVLGDIMTLLPEFEEAGAKVVRFPMRRTYMEWAQLRRLAAYVRTHDISVVNSFNMQTLIVTRAIGLQVRGIRLVHHLISLWDDIHGVNRRAYRLLVRGVDHLICNGAAVARTLIPELATSAPVDVIPNGVDVQRFAPSATARQSIRESLGIGSSDFVIGTVSNIRPVKNVPALIRAFGAIADGEVPCWLVCVGGGDGLAEAQAVAASTPRAAQVVFTGPVTDPAAHIAAFDLFVLPSLSEGNPNVVVQAMATGVPVIASAVGEIPHLLGDGACGITVPAGDEAALAAAMSVATRDRTKLSAWADAALQRARHEYDDDTMIARYVAVLTEEARLAGRPHARQAHQSFPT